LKPSGVTRKLQVLLAEDDRELRELLYAHLVDNGFDVTCAADGHELRALLLTRGKTPLPDVVVSDVSMEGWTGLDMLRWFNSNHPEVPVILMSAFADASTRDVAHRFGAVTVFDKPVDLPVLRDAIAGLGCERDARGEARRTRTM
jgi:DNA-binding NtrC family response regulator